MIGSCFVMSCKIANLCRQLVMTVCLLHALTLGCQFVSNHTVVAMRAHLVMIVSCFMLSHWVGKLYKVTLFIL